MIKFHLFPDFNGSQLITRFGSSAICHGGHLYVTGGVIKNCMLKSSEEVCALNIHGSPVSVENIPTNFAPRPLLIGSTIFSAGNSLVITGGSAVCFSFGTFWNKGSYTITYPDSPRKYVPRSAKPAETWRLTRTIAAEVQTKPPEILKSIGPVSIVGVIRTELGTAADFNRILESSAPAIIEKAYVGSCLTKWTMEYLKEKIGLEREVSIPRASSSHHVLITARRSSSMKQAHNIWISSPRTFHMQPSSSELSWTRSKKAKGSISAHCLPIGLQSNQRTSAKTSHQLQPTFNYHQSLK